MKHIKNWQIYSQSFREERTDRSTYRQSDPYISHFLRKIDTKTYTYSKTNNIKYNSDKDQMVIIMFNTSLYRTLCPILVPQHWAGPRLAALTSLIVGAVTGVMYWFSPYSRGSNWCLMYGFILLY